MNEINDVNIKDRLILFLKYLKIGQSTFEKKCGLSIGTISKIVGGISSVSIRKISLSYPDLNLYWLILGSGQMITPQPPHDKVPEGVEQSNDLAANLISLRGEVRLMAGKLESIGIALLQLVDRIGNKEQAAASDGGKNNTQIEAQGR